MDLAKEALEKPGICYIFSKPPTHYDISTVWEHIPRVTGDMPSLSEKTYCIDMERDCNPSIAATNHEHKNLLINTDKKNMKRKKNQIAETSNASSGNSKKPRLTWNSDLHQKFLEAIRVLGVHDNL